MAPFETDRLRLLTRLRLREPAALGGRPLGPREKPRSAKRKPTHTTPVIFTSQGDRRFLCNEQLFKTPLAVLRFFAGQFNADNHRSEEHRLRSKFRNSFYQHRSIFPIKTP